MGLTGMPRPDTLIGDAYRGFPCSPVTLVPAVRFLAFDQKPRDRAAVRLIPVAHLQHVEARFDSLLALPAVVERGKRHHGLLKDSNLASGTAPKSSMRDCVRARGRP
jgi:hypothetical protein